MISIIGTIVTVYDEKKVSPTFTVRNLELKFPSSKNVEQIRTMQAVGHALEEIKFVSVGDRVEVMIELKGKYSNKEPKKVMNCDEVYAIRKI